MMRLINLKRRLALEPDHVFDFDYRREYLWEYLTEDLMICNCKVGT